MKTIIVISLVTAAATITQGAGQSTKTDPTTRIIRETGSKNVATQDTTADAADNAVPGTNKQRSKPKRGQEKKTGTTAHNAKTSNTTK